jgi:hypothetical protein
MLAKFISLILLAVLSVGQLNAQTADSPGAFNLRGFGTLGLARSSSDHAEFVRDLSQTSGLKGGQWSGRIDSILGLQGSWQASKEFELVGQVVSRLHYDRSHNPELMWAFAKWEPDARLSLRAGRIGADFMMLADSRLVGYSYLPVRPSADFFGPLFFSHFDGADVSVTLPLGDDLVRGKLFAGKTQEKAASVIGVWDTSGSPVGGIVLDYLSGPWQFRMNATRIRFASDMNIAFLTDPLRMSGVPSAVAVADALATKDTETRYYSLGVVYDQGPLQVQGMVNRIRHETAFFANSHAGYLLAGYRVGAVTPFVGVSWWKTRSRGHSTGLPDVDLFLAGGMTDRTTNSLGARWDLRTNMALKFQWDAVRGNAASKFGYARTDEAWNGKTNVLSVVLDFVF